MKHLAELYRQRFGKPNGILEIGSRDGDDAFALYSELHLRPWRVCIVEPHPLCADFIRRTYPFRVIEAAVTDHSGVVRFNAIDHRNPGIVGQSSTLEKPGDPVSAYWIQVIALSGKDLFRLVLHTDLVKIDVEGAALTVLKSIGEEIKRVKMLHVEVETEPIWGEPNREGVIAFMQGNGFELIEELPEGKGQVNQIWALLND